ncbi:MAG: HIT domain-containing protein [Thermodesulfobacteriota bacterium]
MKKLWAPWRIDYIKGERAQGCVFCDKPKLSRDRENLILYRGETGYIIMNRYPYANGHLIALPYRHIDSFGELEEKEKLELMNLINLGVDVLRAFDPDGYNVGMNLGRAAGAGIEDHLHFHVVPRWVGDSNFMPVIADVKVIPEYLEESYVKLNGALQSLLKERRGQI